MVYTNQLEKDYLYPNLLECPYIQLKRKMIKNNFEFYTANMNNEYHCFVDYLKNEFNFRPSDAGNPLFVYEFLDEVHSRIVWLINLNLNKIFKIIFYLGSRFGNT